MRPLKPFQKETLSTLEKAPGHVICVAPTGAGKSRIYEEWCRKRNGRTLLVTPLLALARQQKASLEKLGIAVALGTSESRETPGPETRVWILSPESLHSCSRRAAVLDWRPDLLVVDECHCVWDWGLEFRPAFNEVPKLLDEARIPRSLWLTATLPAPARRDLKGRLRGTISEIGEFALPRDFQLDVFKVSGPDRPEALLRWLDQEKDPGIIFVNTRDSTHRVSRLVSALARRAVPYHAGMAHEERRNTEDLIRLSQSEIVVSTSAFGMGMDHRHLCWAVMWQPPASLLALTQAIGRAGRNPKAQGKALVLWNHGDLRLFHSGPGNSDPQALQRRAREIESVSRFLESTRCRCLELERYFRGASSGTKCGKCDICRN